MAAQGRIYDFYMEHASRIGFILCAGYQRREILVAMHASQLWGRVHLREGRGSGSGLQKRHTLYEAFFGYEKVHPNSASVESVWE